MPALRSIGRAVGQRHRAVLALGGGEGLGRPARSRPDRHDRQARSWRPRPGRRRRSSRGGAADSRRRGAGAGGARSSGDARRGGLDLQHHAPARRHRPRRWRDGADSQASKADGLVLVEVGSLQAHDPVGRRRAPGVLVPGPGLDSSAHPTRPRTDACHRQRRRRASLPPGRNDDAISGCSSAASFAVSAFRAALTCFSTALTERPMARAVSAWLRPSSLCRRKARPVCGGEVGDGGDQLAQALGRGGGLVGGRLVGDVDAADLAAGDLAPGGVAGRRAGLAARAVEHQVDAPCGRAGPSGLPTSARRGRGRRAFR